MAKHSDKADVKRSQDREKEAAPAVTRGMGDPFLGLRQDIDRVFDSYFRGWPRLRGLDFDSAPGWGRMAVSPMADISESDSAYEIAIELPGLDDKDVEVSLRDDLLTVSGEKRTEHEEKEKDYFLSERSYGTFKRSFRLPSGVEADKIKAEMNKGVLSIRLPKSAPARRKEQKIEIAEKKK
ncbi:MAG: Hsp20/alpha crystallin family protein [Kiloniellales bacterium]|nr:Hsp20/alpha crystallin family protein [Kiloniellales bacterium]